ncbi:MAG: vancomycin high temperature exclusion protein [Anaerolineales bacterium]
MALLIFLLLIIILVGTPRVIMVHESQKRTFDTENVPADEAAIVFGAGLLVDGSPTSVLKDRVATAAKLYLSGKINKILMSGDNRYLNYNEPGAMKAYALELGVPENDIVLDYAGRRTYDTCYRARDIFQLSSAILVTQQFHLPRALYTCNTLGLESVGVTADMRPYRDSGYWSIREIIASLVAFVQVHITKPEPVLGDLEPIFPLE